MYLTILLNLLYFWKKSTDPKPLNGSVYIILIDTHTFFSDMVSSDLDVDFFPLIDIENIYISSRN